MCLTQLIGFVPRHLLSSEIGHAHAVWALRDSCPSTLALLDQLPCHGKSCWEVIGRVALVSVSSAIGVAQLSVFLFVSFQAPLPMWMKLAVPEL